MGLSTSVLSKNTKREVDWLRHSTHIPGNEGPILVAGRVTELCAHAIDLHPGPCELAAVPCELATAFDMVVHGGPRAPARGQWSTVDYPGIVLTRRAHSACWWQYRRCLRDGPTWCPSLHACAHLCISGMQLHGVQEEERTRKLSKKKTKFATPLTAAKAAT